MMRFNHGDKAFISGKRVIFGSTRRYYEEVAVEDAARVAKGPTTAVDRRS